MRVGVKAICRTEQAGVPSPSQGQRSYGSALQNKAGATESYKSVGKKKKKKDCTENCLYEILASNGRRVKSLDGPQTDESPNSHIIMIKSGRYTSGR